MARTLNTLFCDDVREEAGNKLSFMGVYSHLMAVQSFPFDLSRLFIIMRAKAPQDGGFKALKFVVMINDDTVAEMEVPEASLANPSREYNDIPGVTDTQKYQLLQSIFHMPPMKLESPCIIRTRIITDTGTVRGDSLVITQAAEQVSPND